MKKLFFLAAIAAATLSACSSDEIVEQAAQKPIEDGAVMFSAYQGRTTRATDVTTNSLKGLGFGVFAFEQGSTLWNTYSTYNTVPNFMYNQKVYCDINKWDLTTEISPAVYRNIADPTLKAKYAGSGNYTSSASVDKAGIDALTEKGLVASDYVQNTANVTFKANITQAEKDAATTNGGSYSTDNGDGTWSASTAPTCADLTAYLALSPGDKAIVATISGSYVTSLTPEKYEGLYAVLQTVATTKFAEASSPNEPKWTTSGSLTPVEYDALTTNADRAICTPDVSGDYKYSPVKYFSNNVGARHSFFAYGPYQENANAVFSLANGAPAIRYNASEDLDLVWANQTDIEKLAYDATVDFVFEHALSKVNFEVSYFNDDIHSDHSEGIDIAENTTITVRSVKFVGAVPSQGVLNLKTGKWSYEATEEGAYEFAIPAEFVGGTDAANTYKPLKQESLVLPTIEGNNVQVRVVYDVTTVDPANPRNNSTVTNTRTSEGAGFALEAGKVYTFKLDLGMTSVKFDATVTDWTNGPAIPEIDLPNNH